MQEKLSIPQEEFACSLYQEHLEEASFLYEQRLSLFDDPEVSWLDIEDFEQRFEAHIDGLVVGEKLTLNVCKTRASEGDFGELHAAVRIFCRQNRKDLVLEVFEKLDPEDAESMQAFRDALKYDFPDQWQSDFFQMLPEDGLKSIPVLADLLGYRRIKAGTVLVKVLEDLPPGCLPSVIWALGRICDNSVCPSLAKYLDHENESVRSATALTLMRLGDQQTASRCLQHAPSESWPLIPLALGGDRSATHVLLESATAGEPKADCLMALGLLGDISAVDILLSHLGNEELAESAATGLNLLTGAELYEEVFISEEIDEDELFEEELEKLKKGEAPTRPDGQPFGTTITRLSQKLEEWQAWWAENKSRFNPGIRYRNGKPYSSACLVENLQSEKSPRLVRQLAYEELVIRYGIDFPFETDMFVAQQKQAIAQYAQWVEANASRFREGDWYFASQLMPE